MKDPMFKIKEEQANDTYGEFVIEPLEIGFGHTLGNSLRRVLLSSIPGAAVTSIKIDGVKHRFSTLPGLKENIVELILNIKKITFRLADSKNTATIHISIKGPKDVTVGDLDLPDGVEVVDKNQYIGSLSDRKAKLDMELIVERGYGYSLAEERKSETLGVIPTDAIFTPVTRVNYAVEATRVGGQTNLDKLILRIWTNGTISPRDALDKSARVLASYFLHMYEPAAVLTSGESTPATASISNELLKMTIDELDLPTRIYNSLRNGGIESIGQLLNTPKKDLMGMRNMGGKSLGVIEEKLQEKGITFTL